MTIGGVKQPLFLLGCVLGGGVCDLSPLPWVGVACPTLTQLRHLISLPSLSLSFLFFVAVF